MKYLLAILIALTVNVAYAEQPLSFKGAFLNMSLQEFKKLSVEVSKDLGKVKTRVHCINNQKSERLTSCRYQAYRPLTKTWQEIQIGFAGRQATFVYYEKHGIKKRNIIIGIEYKFVDEKLAHIYVDFGVNLFDNTLPKFVSFYGNPSKIIDNKRDNPYGVQSGDRKVVWVRNNGD